MSSLAPCGVWCVLGCKGFHNSSLTSLPRITGISPFPERDHSSDFGPSKSWGPDLSTDWLADYRLTSVMTGWTSVHAFQLGGY